MDVDELMHGPDARMEAPARREAEEFLRDFLADGPRDSKNVYKAAEAAGITRKTLRNAKKKLRVKSHKVSGEEGRIDRWQWEMPFWAKGSVVHYDLD